MPLHLLVPVRPITKGFVARLLAVKEPDLLGLRGDIPDGAALYDLTEVQVLTNLKSDGNFGLKYKYKSLCQKL